MKTKKTKRVRRDRRMPDEPWAKIEPLPPPGKPHPLGCRNPRVSDRAGQRSRGDGRDLLPAADRLPVERPQRDRPPFLLLGAPPLPGVDRSGRVPEAPGDRAGGVRRPPRHRSGAAQCRRRDDQGPARGGKRRGRTRPTAASEGPSGACRARPPACRSASRWPEPTATTSSCCGRRSRASPPRAPNRPKSSRKGRASTREGVRLQGGSRAPGGVRFHGPHPDSRRRGAGAQEEGGLQGPAPGRGTGP